MRLTPGALWLRFHQNFRHGLRVAWHRDVVRPRILKTPSVEGLDDLTREIHVLTSASVWLNLIWALKSFYRFSGRRYALCIHDDGTLPEKAIRALKAPGAGSAGFIQTLRVRPSCLIYSDIHG